MVRGFRFLRQQNFFKMHANIKDYIVWMDCGKHFRNNIVLGYLLKELAINEKIRGIQNFEF